MTYIERFTLSPTGLLHIGSLPTAVVSYADARSRGGEWLVCMGDLDPPREVASAIEHIPRTLKVFGFEWDGAVAYQNRRYTIHEAVLGRLKDEGLVYPYYYNRKDWQAAASVDADGFIYSGRYRNPADRPSETSEQPVWRIRIPDETVSLDDEVVGRYAQDLMRDIGDFILLRTDGYWAYQLIVAADDTEQGVTHIVRGQDLLVSTPRQIFLQCCLGLETPRYAHLPLLASSVGQKWSRQTLTPALDMAQCDTLLRQVMGHLNLPPTPDTDRPCDLSDRMVENWYMAAIPATAVCMEWFADMRQKDTDISVYAIWFQTASRV